MFGIQALILALMLIFSAAPIFAQDTSTQQPQSDKQQSDEQKQKEKEAAEKKAFALLDQVVNQVQMLRLPENRIRIQIAAGDLLWQHNQERARSLLSQAGDGVAEMMRNTDGNMQRWAAQLRQELVLTAAQHDAPLAYQLLANTRSLTPTSDAGNNFRRQNFDLNLEQNLLARVAAVDPKFAMQKAEEALAKGQYPSTLSQVISALQLQDKEAATKFTAKVVSKLQSENMLANFEAQTLALNLLRPGPRPAQNAADGNQANADQTAPNQPTANQAGSLQLTANSAGAPVLGESAFQDLMNTVIDAAMKATPQPANNQRGANNPRGRGNFGAAQNAPQSAPSDGQIEQQNARRLMAGLQGLLPQIDQYLPARATAVRNKMTEIGMGNNPRLAFNQMNTLIQQGTTDSLLAAAPTMPPPMQSRIYQQAAFKAIDEGNIDRAKQIANEHLDANTRDTVLQKIDFQLLAQKVQSENMDELRQTLAGLRSDDERIDLLLQLAVLTQKNDPQKNDTKQAVKLLSEAQRLANRRATNYRQFDQQLRVAQALAELEPARSLEVLDPGIAQLNELLSAAALLSGFEVDIFKDGELPLHGGSELGNMVTSYAQQLASLSKIDFDRAQATANRFQLAEPRILVQLSIVRQILEVPEVEPVNNGFNGFGGRGFGRRGQ
jgi:hypothetical protein